MIGIELGAESLFRIPYLTIPIRRTFVTGEKFRVSATIKNLSEQQFLGGVLKVIIKWPNGLLVTWGMTIGNLNADETAKEDFTTDVLDDGPALFLAEATDNKGVSLDLYHMNKSVHSSQLWRLGTKSQKLFHIYTIIPKNAEELYQLWALIVAAISLSPIVVKELVLPLVQWLMSI